jgi:Fuc2NAc and GlcNAc transferase
MPTIGLILTAIALLLSAGVTAIVLRRAGALGLMQQPNARSSHTVATPGGGGVGIVAGGTFAGVLTALTIPFLAIPVIMAALLIAWIGYIDDRTPLPARWRLGAQVLLMGAVVAVLPLDLLPFPDWLTLMVLTLGGALWINLYNFMDGIDGLAGSEAVFLLAGAALLAWLAVPGLVEDPRWWWMLGLAAGSAGFLLFNWPPARIFMGDAGSTYLGLMTGFFALTTTLSLWLSPWQWAILAALFLADSLTTLASRIVRRERFWEGHKRHAYQALQRRFKSHRKATLLYMAIDLAVLLPLAWLAGRYPGWAPMLTFAVFVVLVPSMLLAGAGAPLEQAQQEGPGANDRQ